MKNKTIENIYLKLLKVNHLLDLNLSKLAKTYDFNSTELMIYLDIKTHPQTDLNALCERLGLKKSAASKAINQLIKENQIMSQINEDDQRKIALSHIESEDKNLCKETILKEVFKGIDKYSCNLDEIEEALNDVIKIIE